RRRGTTRNGSKWLRTSLTEAAKAAGRTKGTYLAAQYARLRGRRGSAKATIAVAHSILVAAYYILERDQPYRDLGPDYFRARHSPPPPPATHATIPSAASCGRSKCWATRSASSRRPHNSPSHFHLSRHRAEVVSPALRSPKQRKPVPTRPASHGRPRGGPLVPRRHPELREVTQDHVLPGQCPVPIPEPLPEELVCLLLPQRRCLLIHHHNGQTVAPNACRTNRPEKAPSLTRERPRSRAGLSPRICMEGLIRSPCGAQEKRHSFVRMAPARMAR